jgi:glycosyltransferase involved in cell wall biosynthesis
MRILNVHNVASHYRAGIFRELGRRHQQRVIFFQNDKDWREKQNPMVADGFESRSLEGSYLRRLAALAWELFFRPYDLLLMGFDGKLEPLMALAAARLRRKPCVIWHGLWDIPRTALWRQVTPFLAPFYRTWDAVLTYGPHTVRTLIARGVPVRQIFIAPQTVENRIYAKRVPAARRRALRKSWGLGKAKAALFVGRMVPDKGLEYLAEAVRQSRGRWKLVAVGRGPLQGLADVHLGYVPPEGLAEIYAAADCLVLPSVTTRTFREPWGLVVNEAMNQALPVIATEAVGAAGGGLAEDEVSALVVMERDAAALGGALRRLDRDPRLGHRLGQEGKRRIKRWTYARMADHFEAAFDYARQPLL